MIRLVQCTITCMLSLGTMAIMAAASDTMKTKAKGTGTLLRSFSFFLQRARPCSRESTVWAVDGEGTTEA